MPRPTSASGRVALGAVGLALTVGLGVLGQGGLVPHCGPGIGWPVGVPAGLWSGSPPSSRLWAAIPTFQSFDRRGRGVPKRFAWRVPGRSRWRRGVKRGLLVGVLAIVFLLLVHGLRGN